MLKFAAFTPHPPIIIPEIGLENLKYCQQTIEAMKRLGSYIENEDIDTLIFISPHTVLSPENMVVSYGEKASGDFDGFGQPEIQIKSEIDLELAEDIYKIAQKRKIPIRTQANEDNFLIDHGVMVPLYCLQEHLPSGVKIIVVGFSNLSRAKHLAFGQAIAEACEESDQNIGIIASGDLSHRILENELGAVGQKFDQTIVDSLRNSDLTAITEIDKITQETAGECGYRSLLILLGAVREKKPHPEVLSYEAPFGVGYMVANFKLNN